MHAVVYMAACMAMYLVVYMASNRMVAFCAGVQASPRIMAMYAAVYKNRTQVMAMYAAFHMAVHVAVCMAGCMDSTTIQMPSAIAICAVVHMPVHVVMYVASTRMMSMCVAVQILPCISLCIGCI